MEKRKTEGEKGKMRAERHKTAEGREKETDRKRGI
jgi:hypothetical protein